MKKFINFIVLLRLKLMVAAFVVGAAIFCHAQEPQFQDSMNQDLFEKLNTERQKNGLPELRYYFVMQNTLDQVAENIKSNFCHCYGDTYVTESLYTAGSVKQVIDDLSEWRNKKDNPARRKDIKMVTIGISADDTAYYYVIRTF